jgi:hypothetical protein
MSKDEADRVTPMGVYNAALTFVFHASIAVAGAFAGAAVVQWKAVRGYKLRMHLGGR